MLLILVIKLFMITKYPIYSRYRDYNYPEKCSHLTVQQY